MNTMPIERHIGAWDLAAAQALLARLYEEHDRAPVLDSHAAMTALNEHLHLVRMIVPQHPLWTVNPYDRCDFRCTYCSVYAQGTGVPVLTGDALRQRLRLELQIVPRGHHTALSSMCDAYIPIEATLGVARIAIEELLADDRCVHVVTKGPVVLRDVDLLRRARCGKVEVSLSTLDEGLAATLEPGASSPAERLELVRALAQAGIDVGVMVAPWIPDVTDMATIVAAVGQERRITVSPLKCHASGETIKLAGRSFSQREVNRRYQAEQARFRHCRSIHWEATWRFADHYSSRYLPMTFEEVDGIVRSPEPRQRPAQRLRGFLSSTGIWQRAVWAHVALYRLSRGWCGGTIGGVPHLLLTTTGRRSNQPRTVPLAYVRDGPRFVVVATNGGADNDPAWLLNLRSTRTATIQIGGTRTSVVAHVATKRELMSGWPRRVQVRSARGLALVVLEPLSTD